MCGGQADKEVINFAESFSTELQMWEPIASRMFHPRVGLGEFVKQHTNSNVLSMWGGGAAGYFVNSQTTVDYPMVFIYGRYTMI